MRGHLTDARQGPRQRRQHYNDAVGSLESRVLVQARRFEDHGIEGDLGSPPQIERRAIPLQAPELVEPGEQLRAIDAA